MGGGPGGQDHRTNIKAHAIVQVRAPNSRMARNEIIVLTVTLHKLQASRSQNETKISTKIPHTSIHQPQTEKPQVPICMLHTNIYGKL